MDVALAIVAIIVRATLGRAQEAAAGYEHLAESYAVPPPDPAALRDAKFGHGLEIVCKVNDIPKGSRLAVSTNLLASLIASSELEILPWLSC